MFLSGLLYEIPEQELRKGYQAIVDFADIGDFIDQPVKTYSSGMYVRLAFAIIAHVDADILVVDEALSVGDVRFTQKCMRFLREFQAQGTLLFVSHDTGAVLSLCQRAIWIDHGEIIVDGPAREVVERYPADQHAADRAALGQVVRLPAGGAAGKRAHALRVDDIAKVPFDVVDPRQDVLNHRAGRNLIEVFDFDPDRIGGEFGAGAARITGVQLQDGRGRSIDFAEGGEAVDLIIEAEALGPLESPILGFYVKDRLGQQLFGDNTYISCLDRSIYFAPGTRLRARFRFRMPILRTGEYAVDVAIATGAQDDHTQQHWIRDALVFKAGESSMRHGLVGIPMYKIDLEQVST